MSLGITPAEIDAVVAELAAREEVGGRTRAAATHPDKLNELAWCRRVARALGKGAVYEHRLWDGTRIDILTATHAVEADWSHKWAEAIGQSLWYATMVQKKPAIILLAKEMSEESQYIYRCQTVAYRAGIDVWLVDCKKDLLISGEVSTPLAH